MKQGLTAGLLAAACGIMAAGIIAIAQEIEKDEAQTMITGTVFVTNQTRNPAFIDSIWVNYDLPVTVTVKVDLIKSSVTNRIFTGELSPGQDVQFLPENRFWLLRNDSLEIHDDAAPTGTVRVQLSKGDD